MDWKFLVFGVAVFLILFGVPRLWNKRSTERVPEHKTIKFFDGPMDGRVQVVGQTEDYYMTPYIPQDENGNVDTEKVKPIGQMGDRVWFEPLYAYYQQVTEEDYFYVRDLSKVEAEKVQITGELPKVKVDE